MSLGFSLGNLLVGRGCVLARAGKLGSGRLTGFSGPGTVQAHEVDLDYIEIWKRVQGCQWEGMNMLKYLIKIKQFSYNRYSFVSITVDNNKIIQLS